MTPRHLLSALTIAAGLAGGHSAALAQGVSFHAVLNGGNEIDIAGYANAGDLNGYGSATLVLAATNQICYAIVVHLIGTPTAAHIHERAAGSNGPIRVTLNHPPAGNSSTSSGCVTTTAAIIDRLRRTSSTFYVNVHTTDKPAGAIRGQLF